MSSLFNFVVRDGNGVKGIVDSGISKQNYFLADVLSSCLTLTTQGDLSMREFLMKIKLYCDNLASCGGSSVSYSLQSVMTMLVDAESRQQVIMAEVPSFANLVSQQPTESGVSRSAESGRSSGTWVQCQLCGKTGHLAYIQPPAEQFDKKNASKCEIPPIDLSKLDGPDHDNVVNQIVRAAETLGFFQVVNHRVPIQLLDSLKQTAHNFFSFPVERKAIYSKEVSLSPLVKDVAIQYLKTSHEMVRNLLEVLLGNLGVELDDSKIDAFIEKNMVPEDVDMEKKGEWVEIPPIPEALVINVGDML
ncbi:hypothetical protein Gotur_024051 [Gossypium turneri]